MPKKTIDPNFGSFPSTYLANGLLNCVCGASVGVEVNDSDNYGAGKTFDDTRVCGQCGETHHIKITLSRDFDGEMSKVVLARREAEANA